MSDWKQTLDKLPTAQEKFEYLTGLSTLSWDDCCDAWLAAKNLIPDVAQEIARLRDRESVLRGALERIAEYPRAVVRTDMPEFKIRNDMEDMARSALAKLEDK